MKTRNNFEERLWLVLNKTHRATYEEEKLPYILKCEYVPDFILKTKQGKKIIIEAKGEFDAAARRKMAAVKTQHPHLDIRFVFYRANQPIRRGSNTTHAMWAEKHGFQWADGDIPKKWTQE